MVVKCQILVDCYTENASSIRNSNWAPVTLTWVKSACFLNCCRIPTMSCQHSKRDYYDKTRHGVQLGNSTLKSVEVGGVVGQR